MVGQSDGKQAIIDIPVVKDIVGTAYFCWGCLSEICMQRQKLSFKISGKRLVNKFCVTRKLLLGDLNMLRSLQTQSSKDKQSPAREKKDGKKKKVNTNSASIIKKPKMGSQQNIRQAEKFGANTSIEFLKDVVLTKKRKTKRLG